MTDRASDMRHILSQIERPTLMEAPINARKIIFKGSYEVADLEPDDLAALEKAMVLLEHLASAGTISFHRGIGKIDREGPAPVTPESKIFPVARKVLNAIQAGEWVTVGVMTDRTGINRNSVNPSLKILADAGYLEREQRPDPIRVTWFYRLTSKGEANKS